MIRSIEEGRKEDGNRSIADKIINRLHDLEKTVQNNHGRWAWELLQNAKDSVADTDRKVSVQIILDHNKVEFLHNGNHFTEKDIRGLINQISSKEIEENEINTRTGRFGTGFLTTHLLSKGVSIKGIVETIGGKLFKFGFPLDRDGKTTAALIPKIENAWAEFHNSTKNYEIDEYYEDELNTSFTYALETDEQKKIAQIGIQEFSILIPYVLSFIPQIYSVEITDNVNNEKIVFQNDEQIIGGFKKIKKTQNGKSTIVRLLFATNENVSIAVQVIKKGDHFKILNINDIPKLFCDFPLIGTENFYFPIVVNSFFFNPQTERDGIWLKGNSDPEVLENKNLLEQALVLYKEIISDLKNRQFVDLFNIAKTKLPSTDEKYFDVDWYTEYIQKPLRSFLLTEPIVELQNGDKGKLNELWFPLKSYSKDIQENLWGYTYDLFPISVCKKDDLYAWIEIIWKDINKITFSDLAEEIAKFKTISKLSEYFENDENLSFEWLNKVGSFMIEDETNHTLFEKNAITPNKNGDFTIKSELHIDNIKDINLIEILQFLGDDWNDILLHSKIRFGKYHKKEKYVIATRISERLKTISNKNQNFIKAISILSEWFDNNPEEGQEFFSDTYRKRAELFMNTIDDKDSLYKVMRSKTDLAHLSKVADAIAENPRLFENIEQAEEFYSLLKRYNVNDIQQLRDFLNKQSGMGQVDQVPLLPVTEEILTSMGITNINEWNEAMRDTDLKALFAHQSVPTTDMFLLSQAHINTARKKVIDHLENLDDYDLNELDIDTAPTILAGIVKNDIEVVVVFRPAYSGEVIIYYSAEKDALDYANAELWVDDGTEVRQITLGHILKKNNIKKFPI